MRGGWVLLLVAACEYTTPQASVDGPVSPDDVPVDEDLTGRVTTGLVGLWEFDDMGAPSGTQINDGTMLAPPVAPTITLNAGVIDWLPTSLLITSPVTIRTPQEVNRLLVACQTANAVSLEAWVTAPNATQIGLNGEPARIVTFAPNNASNHPISLGQLQDQWVAQVRNDNAAVNAHGGPGLTSPVEVGQSTHLVVTADTSGRKLYVNGVLATSDMLGGNLSVATWGANRAFVLAGEPDTNVTQNRAEWVGTFHLVAMYNRVLDATEVLRNKEAGP